MPQRIPESELDAIVAVVSRHSGGVGVEGIRAGLPFTHPPQDRAQGRSHIFDDLPDAKVREFNPGYAEAEVVLFNLLEKTLRK